MRGPSLFVRGREDLSPEQIEGMSGTDASRSILIVVDEERLRRALERCLCDGSYRAHAVASGEEALAILKENNVDLVITDLVMPGMDGMSLVRRIRSLSPSTQTIIITVYGTAESRQEAQTLRVAGYLVKPFDLSDLRFRVNKLLLAREDAESPGGELHRGGVAGAVHSLCFAAGEVVGAVVDLAREALCCISPRRVAVATGRSAGTVTGVCVGIGQLAAHVKDRS